MLIFWFETKNHHIWHHIIIDGKRPSFLERLRDLRNNLSYFGTFLYGFTDCLILYYSTLKKNKDFRCALIISSSWSRTEATILSRFNEAEKEAKTAAVLENQANFTCNIIIPFYSKAFPLEQDTLLCDLICIFINGAHFDI